MRTWIYNRIKALGLPTPYGQDGNIISSSAADSPGKQFLLVAMGVEQAPLGLPPSMRAQNIPFTVYVYDDPGSMLKIDEVAVAIKNGLPTEDGAVVGSMSVLRLKWEETGEDGYDDHYKASVRPVRFSMMTTT